MNQAITVSQINRYIKLKIEHDIKLNDILIIGEISNFKDHLKSGHFYFTLKDDEASIKAVMFRQYASNVKFTPYDGQKVIIRGQVSVYERDGIYQIYATEMKPDGIGELNLAFEQLKEKLEKEGLFDITFKKNLPLYPQKIGIITSITGAAVQDMLSVFERRYPLVDLIIYPALVQGDDAAKTLIEGINYFCKKENVDIILLGRGGGSAEDLWCFNDEVLARAIFAANIPIVSCVGHETDYTISDLVADLRAPTPSAAAELCAPNINSVQYELSSNINRASIALQNKLNNFKDKIRILSKRPSLNNPDYYLKNLRAKLTSLMLSPCFTKPERLVLNSKIRLDKFYTKSLNALAFYMQQNRSKLSKVSAKLDALSPLKVLSRGYCLVEHNNEVVTATKLSVNDQITMRFSDGELNAKVIEKKGQSKYEK